MKHRPHLVLVCILGPLLAAATETTTFRLGNELLREKRYELAAIEFRRFAMETPAESEQAAAYLYSGYAYLQAGKTQPANDMLDRAEAVDAAGRYTPERMLLGAETARRAGQPDAALYFYDVLAEEGNAAQQTLARRRAAALHLAGGDREAALQQLARSPADETEAFQALETYAAQADKRPLVGGLLGLFPGAGYWYSGEIANGFRSLILNSLFIYGMAHTAQEDQWGAFSIITFFELTWYSGSVYGGIDAAHRHNRRRLEQARFGIESELDYHPDPHTVVPIFNLNIRF